MRSIGSLLRLRGTWQKGPTALLLLPSYARKLVPSSARKLLPSYARKLVPSSAQKLLPSVWQDRLVVGIFPDVIAAVRVCSSGPRRQPEEPVVTTLRSGDAAEKERMLNEVLRDVLRGASAGVCSCRILLSNADARLAVLPWSAALRREEDWQDFARSRFARTYGAEATSWQIRLGAKHGRAPRLACALPHSFLGTARACCRSAGVTIETIRPFFAKSLALARRDIGSGPVWFVSVEGSHVVLAFVRDSSWVCVRQAVLGDRGLEELPELIDREALVHDVTGQARAVIVHAPGHAWTPGLQEGYEFTDVGARRPLAFQMSGSGAVARLLH